MRFMVDTDTCIYVARKRPNVLARLSELPLHDVGMSIVTYAELRFGAEKSASPAEGLRTLEEFTEGVPVLLFNREVAGIYGKVRLYLQRKGQIIGNNDLWIAAHCLQLGLTLITNNEDEFRRVPNLRIENWTK